MSGASVKLVMNHAGRLLTRSKPRFNDDQKQLIDRAYAGTFGAVYNPGSTKTYVSGDYPPRDMLFDS